MSDRADEGAAADRPVVAVYRHLLLKPTETYIRNQGEAVRRYRSHYVCVQRVAGLALPSDRVLVLNPGGKIGRASEVAFKWLGASPLWVRALRELRPAVLHAHMGYDGAMALSLARRLRIPLVVTFHGFDASAADETLRRDGSPVFRQYLRRREALGREAGALVAVSEFIRRRLLERGFPDHKIVVHYIGVDTELFRPDPQVVREPVVLFAGRLIEKKGLTHLIAAMREVQRSVPDAELVVAGQGPLRRQLERQAAESGVRARFLGVLPPEEVRAWMNRAQLFCIPSVTAANGDSEGLPIVALEAMAMGMPVVGTTSAGIPEAVVRGTTGFLAAERDEGALATHLIALLRDGELRERMGAAGRERVLAHFDLRRQAARLEDIYDAARSRPATQRVTATAAV